LLYNDIDYYYFLKKVYIIIIIRVWAGFSYSMSNDHSILFDDDR